MLTLRLRFLLLALLAASAKSAAIVVDVDASHVAPSPAPLSFPIGGISPSGHIFSANARFLTLDGKPWFPFMGEFHFSRTPADEWEREILKMKAGGVTVVSTYIFWIHHEETEGHFDWSGQRDLGQFVRLCAKHGLYLWLRVGPWAHGEARNGGFPDWLVQSGIPLREDNPAYLAKVRRFYSEIATQVRGQFWADGGPIIGIQIENEYHPAQGGIEHMRTLRAMAVDVGLKAPFYSATGWDRATVPEEGYLPVFGGYTEQFWSGSLQPLPPNQNFFFTSIRAEDNVMGDLSPKNPAQNQRYDAYPFLTAEMGGGMSIAYHRRPLMRADDSTAAAQVKLGSGVTGLGFYMYHGGTNPDGRTSLQEELSAWHGYNDMEAKSYDFQAPLGEFGQVNETYRTLKTIGLFVRNFGSDLAPMIASFPDAKPTGVNDTETPRAAVRSDGIHAFVFLNNYERNYTLPKHDGFQLQLKLAGETLLIPRAPTTLPSGAYPIWPVNMPVGSTRLRYATAQPLAHLDQARTWVFFAWDGLPAEFAFAEASGDQVEAPGCQIAHEGGITYVTGLRPGPGAAITLWHAHAEGSPVRIIVLTQAQALQCWQAPLLGRDRIWLSPASLSFEASKVHATSRNPGQLRLEVYPDLPAAIGGFVGAGRDGIFQAWDSNLSIDQAIPKPTVTVTTETRNPAPVRVGPPSRPVALEPQDEAFANAPSWTIHLPKPINHDLGRAFLSITYEGDVARIYTGARLDNDNFYKGTPWELGLWRYTPEELSEGLTLKILPLRKDAPVFFEKTVRPAFASDGLALRLIDVRVLEEYEADLSATP